MEKFVFKEHSPIGHFISEKGKENFYTAYDEAMALLPSPKETKDIETGYGFVRVYLFTKEKNKGKEPVLLLPGRSSSTPMWEPNLEGLMMGRPVYTIDLLGEPGMSNQSIPIKNQKDQARWLDEVINGLGLEKVHLIGVSIGGWTAMNLARYYPKNIASVSLLDPVFVFAPISLKMIIASIPASVSFVPKFIREKMLRFIAGGVKADESEPIAKLIESGMRNYKLKLPSPDQFSDEDLIKIELPIFALMAENSTMHNSKKAVEKGRNFVGNIKIKNCPNASHAINGEYPEMINEKILEFVEHNSNNNTMK